MTSIPWLSGADDHGMVTLAVPNDVAYLLLFTLFRVAKYL
jgi:hypothetical protein